MIKLIIFSNWMHLIVLHLQPMRRLSLRVTDDGSNDCIAVIQNKDCISLPLVTNPEDETSQGSLQPNE